MKAILKTEPKPGIELCEVPRPQVKPGFTLLKVKACGICGSDIHIYDWTPGYEVMIPFLPVILGHEFAGEVIDIGEGPTELKIGDRVVAGPSQLYRRPPRSYNRPLIGPFANGGLAEYALVSSDRLWKLPPNISYAVGAVCEPLAIAMNAIRISKILPGERAVILGPGPIGLLTLLSLKASGVYVYITGKSVDDIRLRIASQLEADVVLNVDKVNPKSMIFQSTQGSGVDVVYEATGFPPSIQQGLNMIKRGGKLIAIGIHPSPTTINLLDLVRGAKQILGSYSGPISIWTRLLTLLGQGIIDPEPIISHRLSLTSAEDGFNLAQTKKGVKIIIEP
ncbi:MAG: zinc-binding dehydrogenase [Candidatus Bathyarchaeota archaeon]|nr:zinc-binding dehydrogenase [Candidatus Bathyarchaeota archaeon]